MTGYQSICVFKKKLDMLSRYEVTRIVGLRSLQLADGAKPNVRVETERLSRDGLYVAARELHEGKMDVKVHRNDRFVDVRDLSLPVDIVLFLNVHDGGTRPLFGS